MNHEMVKRAAKALENTWDAIGYDVLQSLAEMGEPQELEGGTEMLSTILNTGGMENYGRDEEATKWLLWESSKEEREAAAKIAFPHELYGM